jgi:hypothetical protein
MFDGVPVSVNIRYSIFRVVSDNGVKAKTCRKKINKVNLCYSLTFIGTCIVMLFVQYTQLHAPVYQLYFILE